MCVLITFQRAGIQHCFRFCCQSVHPRSKENNSWTQRWTQASKTERTTVGRNIKWLPIQHKLKQIMQITVLASHTAQKSNTDHRIFQSSLAFLLRRKVTRHFVWVRCAQRIHSSLSQVAWRQMAPGLISIWSMVWLHRVRIEHKRRIPTTVWWEISHVQEHAAELSVYILKWSVLGTTLK